jgi:hypothetical protein
MKQIDFRMNIAAICQPAKQELPLRGHHESSNSPKRANQIELLNMLQDYTSLLNSHLNTSSKVCDKELLQMCKMTLFKLYIIFLKIMLKER